MELSIGEEFLTCGHTKLMPRRSVLKRSTTQRGSTFCLLLGCGHRVERKYLCKSTHCEVCHAEARAPCSKICKVSCTNLLLGTTCHSAAAARRRALLRPLAAAP